ncbi:hypothetical protein NL501_27600, partial [Klebsiella pneumoniae]|nr:hypothetical protein [Klebsiella pneumoniae]
VATLNRARGRQTSYQAVRRHRSIYRDQLLKHANLGIDYRVVPPRMSYYMQKSAAIYDIYLRFIKPEHIHVYSIDEVFMDVTDYLSTFQVSPHAQAKTDRKS